MTALKELRLFLKKNQKQMAIELDVSTSLYQKLEAGTRKPSREFMTIIKDKYPFVDINIFFKEK